MTLPGTSKLLHVATTHHFIGVDMQNYNNYTTLDRSIPTISNVDTFADMKHYYSLVKSVGAALQVRRLAQPACH